MDSQFAKPARLAAIEALPAEMQEHALVDWPTVALLLDYKDVEHARQVVTSDPDTELVHMSERRKLPTWGGLRALIQRRKIKAA